MSKQVEVPEGVQRYSVGSDPDHPGFSEMHPSDTGAFVRVEDLGALYKHFSDRLLSDEAVEAHGAAMWLEVNDHVREQSRAALNAALQATSTPEVDRGE